MIKTWTPIIVALLSILGTIFVAILQSGSASKGEVTALVEQINDKTIPYLQNRLDDIADRLSRIEGKIELSRGTLGLMMNKDSAFVHSGLPKPKPIPRLELEQVTE